MTNKLKQAIELATKAHEGQTDKGGQPYILHPLAVMEELREQGYSENVLITAVLHDVVEDTEVTLQDIQSQFGATIADAVQSVTRQKYETYREFIHRAKLNSIGRIVKMADLKHNSSPERVASLPEYMKSIVDRYTRAIKILGE